MVELENKTCTPNKLTVLPTRSSNTSWRKNYSQGNRNIRNRGWGFYPSEQEKNTEICLH